MRQSIRWRLIYINHCLRGRARQEENYYLNWLARMWYTFKAIVCIVLNLVPDSYSYDDYVHVSLYAGGSSYVPGEPTQYWYSAIAVGIGVFSNWWFLDYGDST